MGCKESSLRSAGTNEKNGADAAKTGYSVEKAERPKSKSKSKSSLCNTDHASSLSQSSTSEKNRGSPVSARQDKDKPLPPHDPLGDGRGAPDSMQLVPFMADEANGIHADYDYIVSTDSSTSSTPQLFRVEPKRIVPQGEGTWEWWYEQVERLRVTKDNSSRVRLQDVPNRLTRQYDANKNQVELDLSWCYMERAAPYVLGRLFASPYLGELRWVTALRLDGNYFTDDGFGNMLAVMGAANERQVVFPLLKNLYLNSMNLDHCSVHGFFFYLFPVDAALAARQPSSSSIAGEAAGLPAEAYMPFHEAPRVPLFPSLEVLSLCDNPSIGNRGLAEILRWFMAPHYQRRILPVLDLSRCGINEVGVGYINEYLTQLSLAAKEGDCVVIARRVVLFGNRHSCSGGSSSSGSLHARNNAEPDVTLLM
ncbi:hypothetical protein TraAM80_05523 [Trypanosoma rangeli]|uniref:Leucine-rich domain-containing protein n=1 Tax=Trypanosoma rangeli TaxID=5698 RepID=A0A422NEI1_TRYRA|nr:uncharacterized protein TraAM80_05523 [Trypanosoma rangeli]RNF03868.1 hypothetical protein TraAM80_05523 [Trypanosoma rangeli]|eukprot:RNF03868.1 hypothetical protein TraAM80_05523 [Trypanosoma rangeli]